MKEHDSGELRWNTDLWTATFYLCKSDGAQRVESSEEAWPGWTITRSSDQEQRYSRSSLAADLGKVGRPDERPTFRIPAICNVLSTSLRNCVFSRGHRTKVGWGTVARALPKGHETSGTDGGAPISHPKPGSSGLQTPPVNQRTSHQSCN